MCARVEFEKPRCVLQMSVTPMQNCDTILGHKEKKESKHGGSMALGGKS